MMVLERPSVKPAMGRWKSALSGFSAFLGTLR